MMILVTGGAGYLGCLAVRALLARGQKVRVVDIGWFGWQGLAEMRDQIEVVQADVRTISPCVLQGCHAVLHLAGLSNDPTAAFNPTANAQINAQATERLARLCKHEGIRRFVFGSTAAVYDRGLGVMDDIQDEDSPIAPVAPYATSKAAAERALLDLTDRDFGPVILRQGTVHGWSPRMRYDLVVNAYVRDAVTTGKLNVHAGGKPWRPMVHAQDMAEVYARCLLGVPYELLHGKIVNVFEQNYTMLELAERVQAIFRIRKKTPVEVIVDYTDAGRLQRSYRISGERAVRLGLVPTRDIATSVEEMLSRLGQQRLRDWYDPRAENMPWLLLAEELRNSVSLVR